LAGAVFALVPAIQTTFGGQTYAERVVENLPKEELSEFEKQSLLYMVQEEKLARDLYLKLYERWRLPIFKNIARSEQHHTNMVRALLKKYGLPDPTFGKKVGQFEDPELQKLYDRLLERGNRSLVEALKVGALVEELDIKDLKERLEKVDNEDVKVVFKNLMKGSRNHLRAFVRVLKRFGGDYRPTYLPPDEVEQILSTPIERGFYR